MNHNYADNPEIAAFYPLITGISCHHLILLISWLSIVLPGFCMNLW